MKKKNEIPKGIKNFKFKIYWIYAIIFIFFIGLQLINNETSNPTNWQEFNQKMLQNQKVEKIVIVNKEKAYIYIKKEYISDPEFTDISKKGFGNTPNYGPHYYFEIGSVETFNDNLKEAQIEFDDYEKISPYYETKKDIFGDILSWILPLIFFIGIWIFIMKRMSGGAGGGNQIFSIGKTKGKLVDKENINVTFEDVAGLEGAKEEIKEIVDFLRHPIKYTKLGGKIPRGAMLIGPPGTGKTLLAKAVAGEAKVPFFSLSGSDFVEMFVGVGAARVRDLFKRANEKAPCIVFIDEIDAIGRSRGRGQMPGSNDERENTLNSLLVEMDGFSTDSGVIILAATNRPDVLDSALLRPGRFDRQISIDKPDLIGREAIFKVHAKNIKLDSNVNIKHLAAQTPGFAGAEIANVCNESALIAARKNKDFVEMDDFQDAIDRVIGGLEKKSKIISPEEKKIVAYHEAGHAITGWFLKYADPLVKVSIVPRGIAALGYAQYLPKEQYLYQTEQLLDDMCMALGGRAAEELVFGKISTGALSDLERITKMAYSMVTMYGMNNVIGNISFFDSKKTDYNFTKPYSDSTAEKIDYEVKRIVEKAYQRTMNLLKEKKEQLEIIAKELLKKEILFQSDIEKLIGKRPFKTPEIKLDEKKNDTNDESNKLNPEIKLDEKKNDTNDESNKLNSENKTNERNNDLAKK